MNSYRFYIDLQQGNLSAKAVARVVQILWIRHGVFALLRLLLLYRM